MLSALAGADALEILVVLKNMASSGLSKLESDVARTEGKVNATNFGGFSKASKTMETDAEKAAGKAEGGGGGLGNLIGSALGLPPALALAGGAVAVFAGLAATTIPVYEKTQVELKATAAAAKAHGIAMSDLTAVTDKATQAGINYGIGVDDVRQSVEKMTLAGIAAADQQAAMPAIMDLAIAKNLSMADATEVVTKAMMGQTKGLKDLGIILPTVSSSAADVGKAQTKLTTATQNATIANQELSIEEQKLAGKHKLTATEALALEKAHNKATDAEAKLKAAQAALTLAEQGGIDKGARLNQVVSAITGATGDQSGTVSDLTKAQTQLSDAWDKFSNTIAPALVTALTAIVEVLAAFVTFLQKALDLIGNLGSGNVQKTLNTASGGKLTFVGGKAGAAPTGGMFGTSSGQGWTSHASGGWVGLRGPEFALLGEQGPEYVSPNKSGPGASSSGNHITNLYLDGKLIARLIEPHLDKLSGKKLALMGTSALGALGV